MTSLSPSTLPIQNVWPRLSRREAPVRTGRRRLCLLTQYFPPEMGAPQARLSELGERLIDLGWEVEALTALPNYPTGKVFAGYDPQPTGRRADRPHPDDPRAALHG